MMRASRSRGFTLLELIVAMAISVIFSVIAYVGLSNLQLNFTSGRDSLEQIAAMQFAMRRLAQDLTQIQPRPIRDELGDGYKASLLADGRGTYALEFTRGGWSNPLGLPRPSLQRVAYFLQDEVLIRRHWRVLDRTLSNEPVETQLLENVLQVQVRFLDFQREWRDQWPPLDMDPAEGLRARPLLIEITFEFSDFGVITRLFEVSG